jgi:4'-phosphopantetheinyl transferase EntD
MIDCPPRTSVPRHRISRGLEVAGCRVDLSIDEAAEGARASADAARLAEDLVAARIGCESRLVRVAALMPSGRPVAMVRGRAAGISVSISHIGGLFGAAVCATAGVGLDIVDPAEAGRSLDVWFTPDELALLPDEDGLLRARLWGAKEAAFKAARLDDGFRPCSVEIEDLGRTGFRWSARREHGPLCGQGIFTAAGAHLVAVAVEAPTITAHQARSV